LPCAGGEVCGSATTISLAALLALLRFLMTASDPLIPVGRVCDLGKAGKTQSQIR
jgi:hypothetical protein